MTIRPAMTALAAVVALSSTSLLAQVPEEPIAPTETDTVAPPPVESDPLAPAPTAETPAAAEPAAAAPTRTTRARATPTRTTRSQPAPRAPAPARSAAATPAAASPAPAAEPIAAPPTPAETAIAEPIAPPPVAAPVEQPSAIDTFLASDEALPVAGAAGLGILALAGAGLVARRRRRRRDAEEAQWQEYVESTPAAVAEPGQIPEPQRATMEPTFVRAFAGAPVAAAPATPFVTPAPGPVVTPAAPVAAAAPTGPATALPEGFDLSRFGPHVQAAYKGPTKDNPSLSLKYRLRRAAALDQMARKGSPESTAAQPAPAPAGTFVERPAKAVPQPATAPQANGEFLLRRPTAKPKGEPAFSK